MLGFIKGLAKIVTNRPRAVLNYKKLGEVINQLVALKV